MARTMLDCCDRTPVTEATRSLRVAETSLTGTARTRTTRTGPTRTGTTRTTAQLDGQKSDHPVESFKLMASNFSSL